MFSGIRDNLLPPETRFWDLKKDLHYPHKSLSFNYIAVLPFPAHSPDKVTILQPIFQFRCFWGAFEADIAVDFTQDFLDFLGCIGSELLQPSGEFLPDLVHLWLRADGDQLAMDVLLVILHPPDFLYAKFVNSFTGLRAEIAKAEQPFIFYKGKCPWFRLELAIPFAAVLEGDAFGGHQIHVVPTRVFVSNDLETVLLKSVVQVHLRGV